jgi:cytochrome c oxidase assembly protein subunit 15
MGCPDWPKCFDQVIPPTDISELPENYKDIYVKKRETKVVKFTNLLKSLGMSDLANSVLQDESIYKEQDFNWKQTWTEYVNRLVGFVAGNLVLLTLIWVLVKYRSNRQLLWLSFLNLILIGFEAWLGAIVVATNLVPWVLTLHMFFALIIVWIQIKIIQIAENKRFQLKLSKPFKYLFYLSVGLTILQILLGSQIRQEVDFMVADNIDRSEWISNMGGNFYVHRTLFWLFLIINGYLYYLNQKNNYGLSVLKLILGIVILEFFTGILFSYANMPAFIQPIHLVLATLLLGVQLYALRYFKYFRESMLR